MKRFALIAILGAGLLLVACAPSFDLETQVPVQVLSVKVPQEAGGTIIIQGRNLGDGRTGGEDENFILFTRKSDSREGERLQVGSWSPQRVEAVSPSEAGNGWLVIVANGVFSEAFPVSLP